MKQKKFDWEIWLEDSKKVERSFSFYVDKEIIKSEKEKNNLE